MEDLFKKGYAEKVEDDQVNKSGTVWYLPHHMVHNPKKPDKVRVVFDCKASYQGVSLNSQVLQGPDLLNMLLGVLLRFRQYPVAVMSDIEASSLLAMVVGTALVEGDEYHLKIDSRCQY